MLRKEVVQAFNAARPASPDLVRQVVGDNFEYIGEWPRCPNCAEYATMLKSAESDLQRAQAASYYWQMWCGILVVTLGALTISSLLKG